MRRVWQWPCALIALLLSVFAGLRSLPGDSRVLEDAETRLVVAVVETAATEQRRPRAQRIDQTVSVWVPTVHTHFEAVRPHTVLRMGSARGPRAP
jgi:hypothetical protein